MSMPSQALCRFRNAAAQPVPHDRATGGLFARAFRPRGRVFRVGTGKMQSPVFRLGYMRGDRPGSNCREYDFLIL